MKVRVTFWSGVSNDFVVSEDILYADFTQIAFDHGGKIKAIEFI